MIGASDNIAAILMLVSDSATCSFLARSYPQLKHYNYRIETEPQAASNSQKIRLESPNVVYFMSTQTLHV